MKFNRVRFKNFLSYGDELQTINLSNRGITFITGANLKDGGSNGAGKSTAVVESIVYGLFGKTTKKIKADNVVNNVTKKDCFVEVDFNIGDDNYKVRRYRKHTEFGNNVFLEKNSIDISGVDKQETQNLIESLLKVSYKSFVSSIVLSQEKVSNFVDSDPTERRKIIENLLMFDFISKYHRASKEILRIIQPEIKSLKNILNEKKESINLLSNSIISYIEKKEKEELNKKNEIKKLEEELSILNNIDINFELENKIKIKELDVKINEKQNELEKVKLKLKSQTKEHENILIKIKDKENEIKLIIENPKVCPVCKNIIKKDDLDNYIKLKRKELDDLKNTSKNLFDEINKHKDVIESIEKELNSLSEEKNFILKNIKTNFSVEELSHSKEKVLFLRQRIDSLSSTAIDIYNDSYVIETTKTINEKKDEIKSLKKKIKSLEEEMVYYEWWKNVLGNSPTSLKSYCVNRILNSLNSYINHYLSFFSYDMVYKLDKELNDVIVKDGENIEFGHLSGGEKRSIEVSLVFALYEIVKSSITDNINIIVLDELLTENFDDVRVNGAIEILNELESKGLSVFVIDHRQSINEVIDCNIILVEKDKNGCSRIVYN